MTRCLDGVQFEDLFHLCGLAEMYGFHQLKEGAYLKIALELVKDYSKCFLVLENVSDGDDNAKDLRNVAFSVLKR